MKRFKLNFNSAYTWLFLLILAIIFIFLSSSYNLVNQSADYVKWSSPDETANYFFTKVYAKTSELSVFEKYNLSANDIVHPRSFRSDWGWLKPVSFPGIFLIFGSLAKVFGLAVIPFFTPIFGALGIIFFYLLVKKLFASRRIALISAGLLACFPVYLYYSARSMFHNILFVSLVLMALYFLFSLWERGSKKAKVSFWSLKFSLVDFVLAALAGSLFGLAIITRTSELLWLAPLLGFLSLCYLRRWRIFSLLIFVAFLFLAIFPMAYWNQSLYGGFLRGGYTEINSSLSTIGNLGESNLVLLDKAKQVGKTIFYFGFKPQQSWSMFLNYVVKMFPALTALAALGFVWLVANWKKFKKKYAIYILAWGLISIILVLYYGSWKFTDNPDPRRLTIGNSYTRYWLPLYLGLMPLAAYFIDNLGKFLSKRLSILRSATALIVVSAIAVQSLIFVLFGSEEGLVNVTYSNQVDRQLYQEVMALTPPAAVVITRYQDKVLWPDRRVLIGLFNDESMNNLYYRLAQVAPLYYLNFQLTDADYEYLRSRKLPSFGLTLELVKVLNKDFALYKLSLIK